MGNPGIALTDPFQLPETQSFEQISLELNLMPIARKGSQVRRVISFVDEHHREYFFIGQWRSYLLIRVINPGNPRDYHEVDIRDGLVNGVRSQIKVISNQLETQIYLNENLVKTEKGLSLMNSESPKTGFFILGNTPDGVHNIKGEIYHCKIEILQTQSNSSSLNSASLTQEYLDTLSFHLEREPLSASLNRFAFNIPTKFLQLEKIFLALPEKLTYDYIRDIVLNILGFIPLGFFAFLSVLSRKSAKNLLWLCLITFGGLLLSLSVEIGQVFLYTRDSQLSDLILNTGGGVLGALSAWFCVWVWRRLVNHDK